MWEECLANFDAQWRHSSIQRPVDVLQLPVNWNTRFKIYRVVAIQGLVDLGYSMDVGHVHTMQDCTCARNDCSHLMVHREMYKCEYKIGKSYTNSMLSHAWEAAELGAELSACLPKSRWTVLLSWKRGRKVAGQEHVYRESKHMYIILGKLQLNVWALKIESQGTSDNHQHYHQRLVLWPTKGVHYYPHLRETHLWDGIGLDSITLPTLDPPDLPLYCCAKIET